MGTDGIEGAVETVAETAGSNQNVNEAAKVIEDVTVEAVKQTKSLFHVDEIKNYFADQGLVKIIVSILIIAIFFLVYRLIRKLINGKLKEKVQPQTVHLLNKVIAYIFYILLGMYILSLFGVNFTAIWGAAGVAGLAIGFAAQTSVSNLISGLFVLGEKSMKIGDFVKVGDICGTVQSIGLLSIRVATLENQMVRIPNSTIISSNLINYNAYETRRLYFEVPLDYSTDLESALESFKRVPGLCTKVLKDPEPLIFYDGFGDGIVLKIAVWFKSVDLIEVKNQMYENIVKVTNEDGIIIPFNHYEVRVFDDQQNYSWGTISNNNAVRFKGGQKKMAAKISVEEEVSKSAEEKKVATKTASKKTVKKISEKNASVKKTGKTKSKK